ncbi:hypothetical protein [Hyphomicrobium sp.]|uniref:hypothetical protein n=1 Tax=Hyphomicrobium sp. TaxID=82 RepID=UPI0025C5A0B5|nr:hypothetical protein [Hyphomicrobium sp.]
MGRRFLLILTLLSAAPVAMAHQDRPQSLARVHSGDVCWDPDVEFPVPCDDDED